MVESRFAMRVFDSLVDCCAIIIALRDDRSIGPAMLSCHSVSPLNDDFVIMREVVCNPHNRLIRRA